MQRDRLEENPRLDKIDIQILQALQDDCRILLEDCAKRLGVPKSTVHYRIRRLERKGIIEHYYAKVNTTKVGKEFLAVVLIRGRYGPGYYERIGRGIAAISGVWAVYYVLGDNDFVVLMRANDRDDIMRKLERINSVPDIERITTQVVAKVIKEDFRISLP